MHHFLGVISSLIWSCFAQASEGKVPELTGDLQKGEYLFWASGCNSCHMGINKKKTYQLGGGEEFKTPYGIFYAPNVSMSKKHGIGEWTYADFYRSLRSGKNPQGEHYYPAFPYTSYSKLKDEDIRDLWSFWKTLPAVESPNQPHALVFPFRYRWTAGIWKTLFWDKSYVKDREKRSTYLVESLAHCAECHTSRNRFGVLQRDKWMRGGPNPSGPGIIPSIHPKDLNWSKNEIIEYLSTGLTPEFDVAGGKMASVIKNTARLSAMDKSLIADYLINLK